MTLEEFIATDPASYGNSNINLFYSSSVSGSTPLAPFTIKGLSVQTQDSSGVDLTDVIKNITQLKFTFGGSQLTAVVSGRQRRSTYFYLTVDPFNTNTLPTTVDVAGNVIEEDSEFVFIPYIQTSFNNNDYNPLINNATTNKSNVVAKKVDRDISQGNPSNLTAILEGTAQAAELQNCSYTKLSSISSKYLGSKTTSGGPVYVQNKDRLTNIISSSAIAGNSPAQAFREFEGSIHSNDSDATTIKDITLSDREVVDIYFDAQLSGSHPNKAFPGFPSTSNYLYTSEGNRLVRSVNTKIYSIDKGEVYVTNEFGQVTAVQ